MNRRVFILSTCAAALGLRCGWAGEASGPEVQQPVCSYHYNPFQGDFSYYNSVGGGQGIIGQAAGLGFTAEGVRASAGNGFWNSLHGTASEVGRILDPAAPFESPIIAACQPTITGWSIVGRGVGGPAVCQFELKNPQNGIVYQQQVTLGTAWQEIKTPLPALGGPLKFLNWLCVSGQLEVKRISLQLIMPASISKQRIALLFATNALLKTRDPQTGYAQDHGIWPHGELISTTNTAGLALVMAMGASVQLLDYTAGRQIARQALEALLATPRGPAGLLPRYVKQGSIPQGDYGLIDHALSIMYGLVAAEYFQLTSLREQLLALAAQTDFTQLVTSANQYRLGIALDGTPLGPLTDFGAEVYAIAVLEQIATNETAPARDFQRAPMQTYLERTFIYALLAWIAPEFGGNDTTAWRSARMANLSLLMSRTFAGLGFDPCEMLALDTSKTAYGELGLEPQIDSFPPFFSETYRSPVTVALISDLDPGGAAGRVDALLANGLLHPLSGIAESCSVASGQVQWAHTGPLIGWQQFLAAAGFWLGVIAEEELQNGIWTAAQNILQVQNAIHVVSPNRYPEIVSDIVAEPNPVYLP